MTLVPALPINREIKHEVTLYYVMLGTALC
jgi:hypothetical protein